MPVTLITPTAYARHRGCDEKAVRKAIAAGRISTIDGKIDPAVADIQWAQNTRARADSRRKASVPGTGGPSEAGAPAGEGEAPAGGGGASGEGGYNDHRTRREKSDADKAELEVLRLAGKLVERERVDTGSFEMFRMLRDRVMAMPRRCAPDVVGMADVREIELAMEDHLRKALGEFDQAVAVLNGKLS